MNNLKGCHCRHSRCNKHYCQCFATGKNCTSFCQCEGCLNLNIKVSSADQESVSYKTDQNKLKVKFTKEGCTCKKTFCLKKYCECFNGKMLCSSNCRCVQWQNMLTSQNNESNINRVTLVELGHSDDIKNKILLAQQNYYFKKTEESLKISDFMIVQAYRYLKQPSSQSHSPMPRKLLILQRFIHVLKNIQNSL